MGGYGGASRPIFNQCPIDHWIMGYAEEFTVSTINQIIAGDELPKIIHTTSANWNFRESSSCFDIEDNIISGETLPIELSRGCMFKCKFCSFPLLGRKPDDKYLKKEDRIFDEMMHNYENFGTTNYLMMCDTFNETTDKLLRVQRAIDRVGIKINFWAYMRIELIHKYPEQIPLLKEMGVASSFFGLETFNNESGKCIGKGLDRDKQLETLQKLKDAWGPDVLLHGGFIMGLPYETKETAKEWTDLLIRRETALDSISVNPLYLVPDRKIKEGKTSRVFFSEFDLNYKKYGYIKTKEGGKNDHWEPMEAVTFAREVMQKFEITNPNKDPLANNYRAAMHPVALMNSRIIDPEISWKDIITPQKSLKETNIWVQNQRKIKYDIYEKYAENVFTQ